jgi:hypothetical protein
MPARAFDREAYAMTEPKLDIREPFNRHVKHNLCTDWRTTGSWRNSYEQLVSTDNTYPIGAIDAYRECLYDSVGRINTVRLLLAIWCKQNSYNFDTSKIFVRCNSKLEDHLSYASMSDKELILRELSAENKLPKVAELESIPNIEILTSVLNSCDEVSPFDRLAYYLFLDSSQDSKEASPNRFKDFLVDTLLTLFPLISVSGEEIRTLSIETINEIKYYQKVWFFDSYNLSSAGHYFYINNLFKKICLQTTPSTVIILVDRNCTLFFKWLTLQAKSQFPLRVILFETTNQIVNLSVLQNSKILGYLVNQNYCQLDLTDLVTGENPFNPFFAIPFDDSTAAQRLETHCTYASFPRKRRCAHIGFHLRNGLFKWSGIRDSLPLRNYLNLFRYIASLGVKVTIFGSYPDSLENEEFIQFIQNFGYIEPELQLAAVGDCDLLIGSISGITHTQHMMGTPCLLIDVPFPFVTMVSRDTFVLHKNLIDLDGRIVGPAPYFDLAFPPSTYMKSDLIQDYPLLRERQLRLAFNTPHQVFACINYVLDRIGLIPMQEPNGSTPCKEPSRPMVNAHKAYSLCYGEFARGFIPNLDKILFAPIELTP